MSRAPVIDTPCPFRVGAMPSAGRDHCGHCDRQVHNLDGMNTRQREAFLKSCTGKVCVAYTVHRSATRRNASLGLGLVAALTGSGAAFAQQPPQPPTSPDVRQQAHEQPNRVDTASAAATTLLTAEQIAKIPTPRLDIMLMGGIDDASEARWADESELADSERDALPEIDELEWLPSKQP
jgi:hypothetical protein